MRTELYSQVAKKVLKDSLHLKKGETLTVETWNNGLPFAREVVKEARRIGCIPITLLEDEAAFLDGVRNASREIVGLMGKQEYAMLSGSDGYVFIPGPPLGTYTRKITRQEYVDSTRYNDSWYKAAKKANLRGVRLTFGYVGLDRRLCRTFVAFSEDPVIGPTEISSGDGGEPAPMIVPGHPPGVVRATWEWMSAAR